MNVCVCVCMFKCLRVCEKVSDKHTIKTLEKDEYSW